MKAIDKFLNEKLSYDIVDDKNIFSLIRRVRQGIEFAFFDNLVNEYSLSLSEWAGFLHISDRTLQRYRIEDRIFNLPQSERIMEIFLLFHLGVDVFGEVKRFNYWLETENLALGKIKPKELLDNTFGINLLKDELMRIAHGVLA